MDILPEIQVNKNKLLKLLPACKINKNVHIQFHSTKTIANMTVDLITCKYAKAFAYLTYSEKDYKFLLLHNGTQGERSAVVLANIGREDVDESFEICTNYLKQFKLAGIDMSWSFEDGCLELGFYVNTEIISKNLEDIDKTINEMCKNNVREAINLFFANKTPPFPHYIDFCKTYVFSESADKLQPFFDGLETLSKKWEVSENYEVCEQFLNCQLMEYQKKTVKWMIEKEVKPEIADFSRIFFSSKLVFPSTFNNNKSLYYYPVLGIFTETDIFKATRAPKGGILADEMGLGKTVEILSLIVSHRKGENVQNEPATPAKRRKSKSTQKHLDWEEYKKAKNSGKSDRSAAVYTVTPEKMNDKAPKSCRKCANCGDMCDLEKCGWKTEFEKNKVAFWCPQCMETKNPLEVKTTLIVLPESLIVQWYNEIMKHVSEDLKVMFYFGINKSGYLHPLEIANFDIILTTYSTLTTEFRFTDLKNDSNQRSNNVHRFAPTSMTHVKWWRLIADESQLIQGASNRAAKMCTRIESHHRWCLTGTPIVRSISDLGGLFRIIKLWPFNVELFWKKHVVAEFLDMSEKKQDLLNSCLLEIASQFMRRNTKKMVEDEFQLPNLVQIEKVVKFTKIEESQYKKEMEDLRKQVRQAIGNVPNESLLNSMPRREKTLLALSKLKETLISCGEHSNFSKCKNVNEQVMSDPKNVMFRLFRAKKSQINDHLKTTLSTLYHYVEIHWLRNDMVKTVKGYEQVADIFLMIKDLNEFFDKVVNTNDVKVEEVTDEKMQIDGEENREPAQNAVKPPKRVTKNKNLKTSNRKRRMEPKTEEVLPQKVAKLEVEQDEEEEKDEVRLEAEEKARKAMIEMRKSAMKPVVVDMLSSIRFAVSIEDLEEFATLHEELDIVKNKMGGKEEVVKALDMVLKEYSTVEMEQIQVVKDEQREIFEQWEEYWTLHIPMKNILVEMKKSYQSKDSKEFLIEKLVSSDRMASLLREMPFWPVFSNSLKHFQDGVMVFKPSFFDYDLRIGHNAAECMGICNKKHVEVISSDYKHSTSSQVLQKMSTFIDSLESLRKELFSGYLSLVDFFAENSTLNLLHIQSETLTCEHKKSEDVKMCVDEKSRKKEKRALKCQICSVLHTLAHLRFAIGTGSFHGKVKNGARKPIDSFFSFVFSIEGKRNAEFDGAKQLGDFQEYMKRLRHTANLIQSSFDSIINYSSCMKELMSTREKVTVDRLRQFQLSDEHLTDEQVLEHFVDRYDECYNAINAKLTNSCKELRYLVNLYKKEQSGSNQGNTEDDDNVDNCCPICYQELEIVSNYPCGHKSCEACYRILRSRSKCENCLQCITCRKFFKHVDVIVERRVENATQNPEQNVIPGMTLAVKLETTIRLMKEIIEENSENNKILLFTTLGFRTPIWQFLTKVLQKAKMPFVEVTRTDYGKSLSDFEFSPECKILLCSLTMCANGLNLTQANHIIFLDPTYLFSVVEQAIGRMSRFGQKREMKVYHMIVEGSIDEEIRKIVKAAKSDPEQQKEESQLTVGELRQIFGLT